MLGLSRLLRRASDGRLPTAGESRLFLENAAVSDLIEVAEEMTLGGFGAVVTFSKKVFIPLTHLCRDVCHYCTFAKAPRRVGGAYLTVDEVLSIAKAGAAVDCKEALFTLGDKAELRYPVARRFLEEVGADSTIDYVAQMARRVYEDLGLLPHLNPGVMSVEDLRRLRPVSASMGLMLESASQRLCATGGPHFGSPDKVPALRLATLRSAGEAHIPMTTGLLIGIGETRQERIDSMLAIREIHETYGNIQELIIQNFRAKPGTKMARATEPTLEDHLWTIAIARILFGPTMSIQAPPNLQPEGLSSLLRAGVNDWGGVSPVTPDHVNPEASWPHISRLAVATAATGRYLAERLAIVPGYAAHPDRWTDPTIGRTVRQLSDARGLARADAWYAGSGGTIPSISRMNAVAQRGSGRVAAIVAAARRGETLRESDIVRLFSVDGDELLSVLTAADELRREVVGECVTYVINRNINYTNICTYHCGFCAFSKGRSAKSLRGPGYLLDLEEIARRTQEAESAGATEVCLQGGIHPSFTGHTYLNIVRTVKRACPTMHVHAFSALEISHGAQTLGLSVRTYLQRLKDAGLSTLPGTAAEILDDDVRRLICADKLNTRLWLEIIRAAHSVGLPTTATIMFGHVEQPIHWARHLLTLRALQAATGGITEFVPLAFVHMEAPLWRGGLARSGPTYREALLLHAVSRLALHPVVTNIQTSWVKMGPNGAAACLAAGANDLGGTLMNESITRAAGGIHGQLQDAAQLEAIAAGIGRPSRQRTTLYGSPRAPVLPRLQESVIAATGV